MKLAALLVAAGCARSAPEPLRNAAAVDARFRPIEQVPSLALDAYAGAARDCRPSVVVRRRFAGNQVMPCGPVSVDAEPRAVANARGCVADALAHDQPFVLEQQVLGIDSSVARGLVGVIEDGRLVVYTTLYDSDPCGGSCPDRGMTMVERCGRVTSGSNAAACAVDATRCFECVAPVSVEVCRFGEA